MCYYIIYCAMCILYSKILKLNEYCVVKNVTTFVRYYII